MKSCKKTISTYVQRKSTVKLVNMVTTGVRPVVKYRLQKKPLTTDNFTCL